MFQRISTSVSAKSEFQMYRNTDTRAHVQYLVKEFRDGVLKRERRFQRFIDANAAYVFGLHEASLNPNG